MKFLAIALVCLFSPFLASPDAQAQHHDTPTAQAADGSLAPLLTGLSDLHRPVTTSVPRAQQFFDQGLRLFYAFNFEESLRAFQEAARLDPSMAMAYWGQAMALGPNLNAPMSDEDGRAAYRAAREAARLAGGASAAEQAYIAAVQTRFAEDGAGDRAALDAAFASSMDALAARFPDDPDAVTLAAAAFMQTTAWDYWQADGAPKPGVYDAMIALERMAQRFPAHGGAHHFLIHLVEASDRYVGRAEKSADLLGPLMPAAGHMVHMPSHIYIRVGRYKDAADANERAALADEDYIAQCRAQGVYPVAYYPHNLHFLWAVGTIEGRSAVAIASARKVAAKVPHHMAGRLSWTHEFPIIPLFAMVTFGQWSDILSEPKPEAGGTPYPEAIWHYARALARVARGETDRARVELAAIERLRAHDAFTTSLAATALPLNLDIAMEEVRSAIALAEGDFDAAIAAAEKGVALQDAMPYSEPALWHRPVRLQLGQALLDAGRPAEAEAVYREEIRRLPENGWGLFGLTQSLAAQGRADDARATRERFEKAWSRADIVLSTTTMMPSRRATAPEKSVLLSTGVRMEYVEKGDAAGVPVVFLHGVTDSWRSFEQVLPRLPASVRAFALSARGHGDSSRPASGYSYADMSADLLAFLDAMRIDKAILVGHSMGSMVAQRFAVDHPERLSGLVLMGSFTTLHEDAGITAFYEADIAPLADPIDPVFAREWQLSTLARPMPPAHLETVVEETRKVPSRVWREAFMAFLKTPDFSEALGNVRVPALVMWGDRDAYAPREAQQRLLSLMPHARLVVYEGAGHGFHWEDADRFVADLAPFLVGRAATLQANAR